MPVTAGWIKVTKVKDDGGKTNRYAKGKGAKSKGKMTQGKSQAKNGRSKAQRVVQEEAVSSLSESEDDEESEEVEEELMYRHSSSRCAACRQSFVKSDATLRCLAVGHCEAEYHIVCLAEHFLSAEVQAGFAERNGQIVPVSGTCPRCQVELLWGDLIRFKRGCYKKELEVGKGGPGSEGEHWADLLTQR